MQVNMALRMLERRGMSSCIEESGARNNIEYVRTLDSMIVIINDGKVNIDAVKTIMALARSDQEIVILIHANSVTSDAKQVLSRLQQIHRFTFDEMAFDLISVVPKHSLVETRPKEWTKFPTILSSDIVSRYYGFKKGDVIRVEEDDGTISYKKCV